MANIVPERLNNFRVYANSNVLLGIADGNFPSLEFMTTEIKGAGIAGTIDAPALGQFGSLTVTLNWRTVTDDFTILAEPHAHELDLYGERLDWNAGLGEYESHSIHFYIKALTKKLDMGKLVVSESQEASTEHECYYIKYSIDNVDQIEIDKMNFIYRVNGTDYLEPTRRALGML